MAGEGPVEDREADGIGVRRNGGVSYDNVGYWKQGQLSPLNTTLDSSKGFLEYDVTGRRLGTWK